jgi:hypothetical protein
MLEVLGVYTVRDSDQPVHLIEVAVSGSFDAVDWGSITQPDSHETRIRLASCVRRTSRWKCA